MNIFTLLKLFPRDYGVLFNLNLRLPPAIILVRLRANLSSFPIYWCKLSPWQLFFLSGPLTADLLFFLVYLTITERKNITIPSLSFV